MLRNRQNQNRGTASSLLRHPLFVSCLLILMGLALLPFDLFLSHPDNHTNLPGDLERIVGLSELFAHGYGVFLVATGIYLLASGYRRFLPRILMCALLPGFAAQVLKSCIGRHRPSFYFDKGFSMHFPESISSTWMGWFPDGSWNTLHGTVSFPSAHAATAWGLALGLAWAFPRGRWLFFGVAFLGSIQRITAYAHWGSDVMFGVALAVSVTGLLTANWGAGRWLGRLENRWTPELQMVDSDQPQQRAA